MNCWLFHAQRNEEVPLIKGSMEECIKTSGKRDIIIYLSTFLKNPLDSWRHCKLYSLLKSPVCFLKFNRLLLTVSQLCCLHPDLTSILGPLFTTLWTWNLMVIKLPNGALSAEILYFTCGDTCCLDFCSTATFLQHSPQAGSNCTSAWVQNSIIVCAKCP